MNTMNDPVPKLPFDEIRNEMNKYGVVITPSTLKHPTTEDVQGVYSICIKYILNKDINNIRIEEFTGDLKSSMPSIDGIQILPNEGKNHLQAIGNLRFFRHCEKINKILNMDNTLSYIFKPTSGHITKLINAFMHFMRYREQIYNENDATIKQIEERKNESNVLDNELKSIQSELQVLLSKHEEVRTSILNEKNIKRDYEEEIIENQNSLNSQQSILISLKSTKDRIVNETNELIFQFSRYRQKKEDLEDQIVPSPEKLQQYNDELKDLLYEHMSHCETSKKKNEDIKNKINIADLCIKKLVNLLTILTSHINETLKVHIDKKNKLKDLGTNLKSLKEENENLTKKKREHENILNETENNFLQEKNKWDEKIQDEKKNTIIVEENVKQIRESIDGITTKTNQEIKEINNIVNHIQDTVNIYNKNFAIIADLIENTKKSQKILKNKIQNNIQNCIKTHL
ncbi:kinetochore protein NUF2, putative [Plasmodium berghei]|uniref:Kinetochore protein NUF2, putative n=2 Tax=Plasmodium berghei TaxID=5821 RepID=A0A509AGI6_PLABA|nr:kinetochore protein NUF2, putative [Plasmodium berghei ANKA]SCL92141.1 kinetochore protein NUF2, putative [Plasmodium berghei]SCM15603.1 kinetochore protein NUF2, putative [Plasmodium berghei]SCM17395.1 kinetochore protein NUF2, putative [Plasmodium berghei]SCN22664.1 kinetochore protein NUF2, putative [Plasmodium berghei]VUC54368.1 kinetochore protein NUF2, putative [Plasmodium berghei ANKA]|eukprot:XP_034420201.1 kinetochore protein NUF2, putative [Plasmodium berghei ANKA]